MGSTVETPRLSSNKLKLLFTSSLIHFFYFQIEREREGKTKRQKFRETERQRDRETERQRDRETERQRDRETEKERERDTHVIVV